MSDKPDTTENLHTAFSGESQANTKYRVFAEKADREGLPMIAKLFRAISAAEQIHAANHLKAMDGVHKTLENLAEAQAGEKYEFTEMYPPMIETAKAEGNARAGRSMHMAMEVEKVHFDLYAEALAALKAGGDMKDLKIWICPICGHTVIGTAPEHCPVCNCPREKYIEIA